MEKRRKLKNKDDKNSIDNLKKIEDSLVELCAKKIFEIINDEIENLKNDDGGANMAHLWKLKKKL